MEEGIKGISIIKFKEGLIEGSIFRIIFHKEGIRGG